MWELFRDIELPTTTVLIAMEKAGIHLDCYRLGEITGKLHDQMEELESAIYELAGEEFNLGSPQQLGRILFDRLGLLDSVRPRLGTPPTQERWRRYARAIPSWDIYSVTASSRSSCRHICSPCLKWWTQRPDECTPRSTRPSPRPDDCRRATPICRTYRYALPG